MPRIAVVAAIALVSLAAGASAPRPNDSNLSAGGARLSGRISPAALTRPGRARTSEGSVRVGISQGRGDSAGPPSPAIESLRRAAASGDTAALAAFWARVSQTGTPLVEPATRDTADVLITFLWRGDTTASNVVLMNAAVADAAPARSRLRRIPGTDVWYRTYLARADARFSYEFSVNDDLTPFDQVRDWAKRTSTFRPDPLNSRGFRTYGRRLSVAEGPRAPPTTWVEKRPGVASGRVSRYVLPSRLLGNSRRVWVYTPPGFDTPARRPAGLPLLVVLDGEEYTTTVPTPTMLDNLIAAGRVPALVAVFVGNVDARRDEELTLNPRFSEFVATEIVPWARSRFKVSAAADRTTIAGSSFGGLAATFTALRHPTVVGNVLSQSGSFWFSPEGDDEPEMIARSVSTSPPLPIRFYLEVGVLETGAPYRGVDQLAANRHFRDVLRAKGYDVTYHEYFGGHEYLNWRDGLPPGLMVLITKP